MKILLEKSQVAPRKCKGNSRSLNAGQLKSEGAIERLIHLDERFQCSISIAPMRATEILYPLEEDTSPCKIKQLIETWKTIKKQLNDLKEGECMTFEELLLKLMKMTIA